jgi:D-alanine-D-alanine ligase
VDYSQYLIECAAASALERDYSIDVVRSDARNTGLSSAYFHHVLILGNSLGYIQTESADVQILLEAYRVLRPGGFLLVDVTDGKAIKASFKPNAWHDIDTDTVVCRQRELHGDTIRAREMVLSKQKGLIRDKTYAVRLYESDTLEHLFKRAGFKKIAVITDFSPHLCEGDFGFMNCRMIATGRKE